MVKSKQLNFKFDDSAIKSGRKVIGFRIVGEPVDPKSMTYKEYIHYLCYKFGFKIGKGWDGIERNNYIPNWTPDESHCVENRQQALDFLGISDFDTKSYIEKRNSQRRSGRKDIRLDKTDRRTAKQRRKDDIKNHIIYYLNIFILFIVLILWGSYSVYLYIEGVK